MFLPLIEPGWLIQSDRTEGRALMGRCVGRVRSLFSHREQNLSAIDAYRLLLACVSAETSRRGAVRGMHRRPEKLQQSWNLYDRLIKAKRALRAHVSAVDKRLSPDLSIRKSAREIHLNVGDKTVEQ
jgi:hypothetical protein